MARRREARGLAAQRPRPPLLRLAPLGLASLTPLWLTRWRPLCATRRRGPLAGAWALPELPRWSALPERKEGLRRAKEVGLFEVPDRGGQLLSEDELMWTGEYASGGSYEFWSLGQPKRDFVRLASALPVPEEGMTAAILGCGLGLEVDYLARAARNRTSADALHSVSGVDFASTAVDRAREAFGRTPGATFYHADVCELPPPVAPLDLLVDNTVFQNVRGTDREEAYLESLRRLSVPGHTVLHLNLMSQEGVDRRPDFVACMDDLNLPLQREEEILEAFSQDWALLAAHEGLYDLRPEGAGFECEAFYTYGGNSTPGIPSWWMLFVRK